MQAIYLMCVNLIKQFEANKIANPRVKFDVYYKNHRLTKAEYDSLCDQLAVVEAEILAREEEEQQRLASMETESEEPLAL